MEHKVYGDTDCNCCTQNGHQSLGKGMEEFKIRGQAITTQIKEYWEESWRPEHTCSHLNSTERPSAITRMKN